VQILAQVLAFLEKLPVVFSVYGANGAPYLWGQASPPLFLVSFAL
jgi:hypothetical protein